MSDVIDIGREGPDMTAAEFALGVLEEAHHSAAAARVAVDPGFAAEVADWELRLAPLADEIAPVAPPAHVWPKIEAAIAAPASTGGMWNSLALWRTAAGIAALGVVVMATQPLWRAPPPTPPVQVAQKLQPILVATLAPEKGKPASIVATLDPNTKELVLTSVSLTMASAKSPELWVIPKGHDPISLGVMDLSKPYRIPLPKDLAGADRTTAVLAVTAEQSGGSPDGKPHGPIVAAGGFET